MHVVEGIAGGLKGVGEQEQKCRREWGGNIVSNLLLTGQTLLPWSSLSHVLTPTFSFMYVFSPTLASVLSSTNPHPVFLIFPVNFLPPVYPSLALLQFLPLAHSFLLPPSPPIFL